jgi:outer membrane protein TolC
MVNYNPSIKVQNLIIESARSALRASQNQKNPNVSLRAGINTPAEDILDNTSANIGFVVNYIYDDGGRLDSQIEGINSQIKSTIKRRDDLIKGLNKQLDLSYETYLNATEAKIELEKLIKLLKETLDTSKAQLVTGRAKIQDVLKNELDLAKKKIDLISVNSSLVSASYNIKYLTSGIIPKITK